MGIFKVLSNNVVEIGVMSVSIVLISILLNSFKTSANVCPGADNASHTVYQSAGDICHAVGNTASNSSINDVGSSINTSVTGVGTPITYIGIIILVIIFAAILATLVSKLRAGKGGF